MEQNELKHPHVSPSLEEQQSVINDEKVEYWQYKRRKLVACLDSLAIMRDLAKGINDKCDAYLQLDDCMWDATRFNYLAVKSLSDGLYELLRDYVTNTNIAIQNWDYDNQRL